MPDVRHAVRRPTAVTSTRDRPGRPVAGPVQYPPYKAPVNTDCAREGTHAHIAESNRRAWAVERGLPIND